MAYVYDNFAMGNKGDEIVLDCAGVLIDEVIYDEFVVNEGAAAQLSPDKFDPVLNDDMKSWCKATKEFGPAGKKGTPGAANTACPEPSVCDPNPCT